MRALHWFRTDLRISDNTALIQAVTLSDEVFSCYLFTKKTFEQHNMSPAKRQFILDNLNTLSESLKQIGIPLFFLSLDYFSECSDALNALCQKYKIDAIFYNKQYEYDEKSRDAKIGSELARSNIQVFPFDDQTILAPGSLLNKTKTPFKVFTPFKKAWISAVSQTEVWKPQSFPRSRIESFKHISNPVSNSLQVIPSHIDINIDFDFSPWPAGEFSALERLNNFCTQKIKQYHIDRDHPSLDATSKLSPYLTLGVISPRQCVEGIIHSLRKPSFDEIFSCEGSSMWLSELIWRDFYKYILYHFPKISRNKPFKSSTENIIWNDNPTMFNAWCEGLTGYPLIDAAMRQLKQLGWVHNRLRMLVANFLTKSLFINWQLGERFFMEHLIDGDLAANNGGWQWSASTGTDAVPYFRIFNPIRQSEKFDEEGRFIKKYCPELSIFDSYSIHDPHGRDPKRAEMIDYPKPIVQLGKYKNQVFSNFKLAQNAQHKQTGSN